MPTKEVFNDMKHPRSNDTQSVRIPSNYYSALRERAKNNKRPLVTELTIILDEYLDDEPQANENRKLKALSKVKGIIKNLPKKNHGQSIDKELYEE